MNGPLTARLAAAYAAGVKTVDPDVDSDALEQEAANYADAVAEQLLQDEEFNRYLTQCLHGGLTAIFSGDVDELLAGPYVGVTLKTEKLAARTATLVTSILVLG